MKTELIIPCGMNCDICSGYLALAFDVNHKVQEFHTVPDIELEIKNVLSLKNDAINFRIIK